MSIVLVKVLDWWSVTPIDYISSLIWRKSMRWKQTLWTEIIHYSRVEYNIYSYERLDWWQWSLRVNRWYLLGCHHYSHTDHYLYHRLQPNRANADLAGHQGVYQTVAIRASRKEAMPRHVWHPIRDAKWRTFTRRAQPQGWSILMLPYKWQRTLTEPYYSVIWSTGKFWSNPLPVEYRKDLVTLLINWRSRTYILFTWRFYRPDI